MSTETFTPPPPKYGKPTKEGATRFAPLPKEAIASWDRDIHRAYVAELRNRGKLKKPVEQEN